MQSLGPGHRFAATAVSAFLLACALASCTVAPESLDRAGGLKTAAPISLTMAAPNGSEEIGAYADAVARLSDDSVQIDLLSRADTESRFGLTGGEIVDAVRAGEVPLALLPARDFGALGVSSLDALQAPFVIDSLPLEAELLRENEITQPMLDEVEELGVEGVGILVGPLVHPFGISDPVQSASDFAGATIAVGTGDVAARTLTLLGARPVESEFNGAPVDGAHGALLQLPAVVGNSYHRAGRSVTADVTMWPRPLVVIANSEALAALTDEQQEALRGAAAAAAGDLADTQMAMDVEAARIGCGAGLSLPTAGAETLDELREAVRPLIDEIAATEIGGRVFARVEELRQTLPAPEELLCVAVPADWPTSVSDRLDGTYTADTTADDLRDAGVPEYDVVDENWGHWVLVVKDGRFAYTQENERACTWGAGDWRMDDQLVRMTFERGGGISPNGVINKPGEDFVYDWTDFGGTLELTLAMDEGPDDMAYTRVTEVADVTAFPDRCAPPDEVFAG